MGRSMTDGQRSRVKRFPERVAKQPSEVEERNAREENAFPKSWRSNASTSFGASANGVTERQRTENAAKRRQRREVPAADELS